MNEPRQGDAGASDRYAAALIDLLPEMVIVAGSDLTVKYVNQRLLDDMGYTREAVIGTNIFDYVHPDDHEYLAITWGTRAANPGKTGILIEARGRNSDGTWRAVEVLGMSLLEDGVIDGMLMTMRDLVRKVEGGYDAGRIRSMLDRTTDIVLLVGRDGRILFANRRLTSSLGADQDQVVGTPFTGLLPPEEHERFEAWFAELIDAGDRADARIRLAVEDPSDSSRTVEWHGTNQLDDPLIAGLILSGRDVTELVDMERRIHAQTEQLRHSAGHDALTGLLNRTAFIDATTARLADRRAAGDAGEVGDAVLLFCDLDRFKLVNDTHGHAAGDHVLRVTAERLRSCLREGDVVARWGGDEFTVLLDASAAEEVVDDLVHRIRARLGAPIADGQRMTAVGVTIGVSRAPIADADALELLSAADEAMYARKASRR